MMRKLQLLAAMVVLTAVSAFAAFPDLEVSYPFASEITKTDGLNIVRVKKVGYTDKQNLQAVANGPKAYLLNLETDEEILATATEVSGTGTFVQIAFTFPALTANGEYQVVIPAGVFETADGHETNPLFELKTFTMNDPTLDVAQLTPVTLTPAAGTALKGVNSTTGPWTIAFAPEIQKEAGYMKVVITDADAQHLYDGEPFYSQIQINRREVLGTGEQLETDLTKPFSFTWGGKKGSGIMYQGYTYKCRFEVRKSEYNEAKDGIGEVLGIYECTYTGNTLPEQYADIKLVNVTPTPADYDSQNPDGYIFENTNDPHITLFFDKPVEPNLSLCAINTGYGTSVPFEGTAESSNEGKEWRFTVPKSQITVPEFLAFFAFKDPATGLPVKGTSGRGEKSVFQFRWNVEIGLPTLSVASPDPAQEHQELSSITLTNSEDYFFHQGSALEAATISTRQGEVVYTFRNSDITFDNAASPKTVTLAVNPAIAESGSYVLIVPKGYFMLSENAETEQGETTYQNKAFTGSFTVVADENPVRMNAKFKESDPANGSKVKSLKKVEILFDLPEFTYITNDYGMTAPALKNEAGDDVATVDFEIDWDNENGIYMNITPEITEPGTYSIAFPDKYFYQDESDNYTPAFTLSWTIEEELAEIAVASPETQVELEQLSAITLSNEAGLYFTAGTAGLNATIDTKEGDIVYTFKNEDIAYDNENKTVTLTVNPAIAEGGTYVLNVPKGFFVMADNADASAAATAIGNKALFAEFYVKKAEEPETFDAKFKNSNPENESFVTSLKDVEIFFDIPEGEFIAMNYDMEKPALKNATGNEVATIDLNYGTANNSFAMTFNTEIAEPGTYSITFPAKFFYQDQSNNFTPEFTLTWSIRNVGISGIIFINGVAGDVYAIDGTLIVRNATIEDINSLDKGIYLIGGKKFVAR